ncbi:MAG: N-acetyltransferase family protein [Acidimicrobiales bacterium]|jgi:RimJ/RimL family protein N-acetyltransferase
MSPFDEYRLVGMRHAVPADAPAIAEYHHRARVEEYRGAVTDDVLDALNPLDRIIQWNAWLSNGSPHTTMVAEHEGAPVGHVTVLDDEILHVYVDPDHWGQGLGRRLLDAGEQLLKSAGFDHVFLQTHDYNHRAIKLYLKSGWAMTGDTVRYDVGIGGHIMEKHLQ